MHWAILFPVVVASVKAIEQVATEDAYCVWRKSGKSSSTSKNQGYAMNFVFYVLVYNYLNDKINTFGVHLMTSVMTWVSAIALVVVTLRIMTQGYRIITGQSRDSMMALVTHSLRVVLIVFVATSMSLFGSDLHHLFTTELSTDINQLFTGNDQTAAQSIDNNLANTALAMGAIQAVQTPPSDAQSIADKGRAIDFAIFGTASPPMAAGAMLLLYSFAIALFIGLGPLFILCLLFEQTKELFRKWLMYGIGTIFSMALLSAVTAIVMDLTARVAAALWTTQFINGLTGSNSEGLSNQAMQQGGVGLLMTVLIISVPPMAAMFFQGTMGSFMHFSAFSGGAASRPGPQGQPPGSYGYGGYGPSQANAGQTTSFGQQGGGVPNNLNIGRMTGNANSAHADVVRPANPPTSGS
jgi:type IV secretion system protein VirB6